MASERTKVERKTIVISYENVEAAIVSWLYALGVLPESWDVLSTDLGIQLNEDGFVEFEIEVAKPVTRPKLQVVDEKFIRQDNNRQLDLPFETFERINVRDPDGSQVK